MQEVTMINTPKGWRVSFEHPTWGKFEFFLRQQQQPNEQQLRKLVKEELTARGNREISSNRAVFK